MRSLLVIICYLLVSNSLCYVVDVLPGDLECFSLWGEAGGLISGNFEKLSPDIEDSEISVHIVGPKVTNAASIYSSSGEDEDTFNFIVESTGLHSICFQNGQEDEHGNLALKVGFNFRWNEKSDAVDSDVFSFAKVIQPAEDMEQSLLTMKDHIGYMNSREGSHRAVMQGIRNSVSWWNIIESVSLMVVAICQIACIRKFFDVVDVRRIF